jgi:ADP-ribose pyrophosphatase YjhB (NUDIX family)
MPSSVNPTEIVDLAARFGTPLSWKRTLDVSARTLEERRRKNEKRRGEVVFAMPRPEHRVLLHTKSFYPPGSYRLLTGGIDLGEGVEAAARREILEETSLDAALARFLGVVEYDFRHAGDHVGFVSYVFLTTETTGTPHALDAHEQIADFREVSWSELERVAERLENLLGDWHDWGEFRAIPHRLVLQAIQEMHLTL